MARLNEFAIIEQYFHKQGQNLKGLTLGIGDDCALIETQGLQAISVDTSIAGRHFPSDAPADAIAYRALNVALSDLAAMGAKPTFFTLAISLLNTNTDWLALFSQGLFQAAKESEVTLIGGDTTKGPLSITVQVQGDVPKKPWLRSGAKVGDYIYLTEGLGRAGQGLADYFSDKKNSEFIQDYLKPQPAFAWVNKLQGKVQSAIDVSDGLLADLQHILTASNVGAQINAVAVPDKTLIQAVGETKACELALTAGDDYKLCITSPNAPNAMPEGLVFIGRITAANTLVLNNQPEGLAINKKGFEHFYE